MTHSKQPRELKVPIVGKTAGAGPPFVNMSIRLPAPHVVVLSPGHRKLHSPAVAGSPGLSIKESQSLCFLRNVSF